MTNIDQNALAREAYDFWLPHVRLPIHAYAILGDIDGECSFRANVVGDHGEAYGLGQWHATRADAILKGCGIDVRKASFGAQLDAMLYEMSKGGYSHVLPTLDATETLHDAITVLVSRYEQSGSQARDVTRRVSLAEGWMKVFGGSA